MGRDEALRLIEKERITYFVGVPTMSLELMNHPDRDKYDLSSLKDITAGGAPRPVSHVERLKQEFPNAQPALGYGLTETNATGCANFGAYADKPALDRAGRRSRWSRSRSSATAAASLADRRVRRDRIRTAAKIKGYWRNPEATADDHPDGYSAPATSAISTRTAICSSSTARRKSSSAAARIFLGRGGRGRLCPTALRMQGAGVLRRPRRAAGGNHLCEGTARVDETGLHAFLDGKLKIVSATPPPPTPGTGPQVPVGRAGAARG